MTTPNKWAVRDVAKASFFNVKTGKLITYLSSLKTSGVETKATTVYAKGGTGNVKLVGFTSETEATITLQDALFDNRAMAMLTGNSITKGASSIYRREELHVSATNTITLSATPLTGTLVVYGIGSGDIETDEYVAGDPTTNADAYSITNKVITLNSTVVKGTKIVAYYQCATGASSQTISVTSDKFAGTVKLVLDVLVKDLETKELCAAQMIIHNAQIEEDFKFDFKPDGDPSVLDMKLQVLKASDSTAMWDLSFYDEAELV